MNGSVFCQELLHNIAGVRWGSVMMKHPATGRPQLRSFSAVENSHSSAISRTVKRRSLHTRAFTLAIMFSLREVDGRPERGSLSADSRPSLNRRNHSKTRARLIASSANAVFIISYVSVPVLPSLKQNLMQIRCSMFSVIFSFRQTHATTPNERTQCG